MQATLKGLRIIFFLPAFPALNFKLNRPVAEKLKRRELIFCLQYPERGPMV